MDDCVEPRRPAARAAITKVGAIVQLCERPIRAERVEHLTQIRDVGLEIVDAGHIQRHEIDVEHLVAECEQLRNDVLAGLATTACEEDAHVFSLSSCEVPCAQESMKSMELFPLSQPALRFPVRQSFERFTWLRNR